jgi:heme o synthase
MKRTVNNPSTIVALRSKLRDYYTLTKPEVNLLILITTSAGFYLGSPIPLRIAALTNTVLGTLLVASGTATLNQWMESAWDARMHRTAKRPIPAGRISAQGAFMFGVLLSIAGGIYLAVAVNGLSSLLAVSTLLSYLLIYTPLKRKTPLCTLLGAFPGAMPTLIGWAGAADHVDARAWYLFAILFLWQFPHFLAIALMYRDDYVRAGYRMLPTFDQDSRFTRAEILGFSAILVITTLLPVTIRNAPASVALMALAGSFLLYHVIKLTRSPSPVLASRVLHASIVYLPVVLGVLVAYKP